MLFREIDQTMTVTGKPNVVYKARVRDLMTESLIQDVNVTTNYIGYVRVLEFAS
jgi:hypothetical protein